MKVLRVKQGSSEWHEARLGKPSASNFERIITPAKLERSSPARTYLYELLAEWLTGVPHGADTASAFMQRGTMMEPEAARWYEYEYGVPVDEVGCVMRDDEMVVASPDRLVGADGLLELKCPAASTHIRYLVEGLTGYKAQVQGQLWIAERAWVDLCAYHPDMPPVVVRVERDEKFIAALDKAVSEFVVELQEARAALLARGCVPPGLRLTPALMAANEEPF